MSHSFQERRLRVHHWLAREPPAEEMLVFYLGLLELQEPVYHQASASEWLLDASELRLGPLFRQFLDGVVPISTEVIAAAARSLLAAGEEAQMQLVEDYLLRRQGEEDAPREFLARAYLQPVAEAAAEREAPAVAGWTEPECPHCGWPQQVGVLRDEPEVKGRRLLVCALCQSWWPFPRSRCPACGETDADKLAVHVSESMPHVRVEECRTCGVYLKSVDLRKDGRAVPVVEDLASVELDLWCQEKGLRKLQRNLMGL